MKRQQDRTDKQGHEAVETEEEREGESVCLANIYSIRPIISLLMFRVPVVPSSAAKSCISHA